MSPQVNVSFATVDLPAGDSASGVAYSQCKLTQTSTFKNLTAPPPLALPPSPPRPPPAPPLPPARPPPPSPSGAPPTSFVRRCCLFSVCLQQPVFACSDAGACWRACPGDACAGRRRLAQSSPAPSSGATLDGAAVTLGEWTNCTAATAAYRNLQTGTYEFTVSAPLACLRAETEAWGAAGWRDH